MIGTTIGNYQIVSQIGEGGMGAVYLARHAMLGRRAAIKVLLPALSNNREQVARFFNEARAATAVQHPGIVEIYDFGYLHDGSAYISMEFLDGESLATRLRGAGRVAADRALAWVRQIGGPLRAAHERGIVHRDLKPDNIFLVRDPDMPGGERIKLLDFGIAKLSADVGDGTSRTRTGAVMGTPTYMAPEQCRGSGSIDHRADLYALGCILYEMLCGRPPFISEGAGDVIAHHLYFPAQPPRELDPSIPAPVEQLAMWMLEKDPQRRPQSVAELLGHIDQLVASGAVASSGPGPMGAPTGPQSPRPVTWDRSQPPVTTLSHAAGPMPTGAPPTMAPATGRRWLIPTVAGAVLIAGVIAVVAMSGGGGGGGEAPKAAQTPEAPTPPAAAAPTPAPMPIAPTPAPTPAPMPLAPTPAPTPSVEAPPPPPIVEDVKLTIDSTPAGAEVLLGSKVVGKTPFAVEGPPAAGTRTYTVRAKGYRSRKVTLSTDASDHEHVTLEKRSQGTVPGNDSVNPFE